MTPLIPPPGMWATAWRTASHTSHTCVCRAWTRVWDDAVDPPTWHVGDSLAYRLANHWDLTPKQDCPLKMREEEPRCGGGGGGAGRCRGLRCGEVWGIASGFHEEVGLA